MYTHVWLRPDLGATHQRRENSCTHILTHACTHVYTHACTHVYSHVCTHVCTHVRTHLPTHMYVQIWYRMRSAIFSAVRSDRCRGEQPFTASITEGCDDRARARHVYSHVCGHVCGRVCRCVRRLCTETRVETCGEMCVEPCAMAADSLLTAGRRISSLLLLWSPCSSSCSSTDYYC